MGKKGIFDILKNVQPSTTTTLENLDINGLNLYEGKYAPGDVISYNFIGTMPSAVSIATLNGYVTSQLPLPKFYNASQLITSSPDIDVYELVYWGRDSRSSDTIRQSATLLVPKVIVDSTIVSSKHGTIGNTWQQSTLWNFMKNILEGDTAEAAILSAVIIPGAWFLATTGYITICADNPGYGTSLGFYNFGDPYGETFSQYNALVAASQLITQEPDLFITPSNASNYTLPLNVINCGYSLAFVPFISQLIASDTANFTLLNTICGAPTNPYALVNKAFFNNSDGATPTSAITTLTTYSFELLTSNASFAKATQTGLKPSIINNVLPLLNQLYLDTATEATPDVLNGKLLIYTQAATLLLTGIAGVVASDGTTPYTSAAQGLPYIVPSAIVNATSYLDTVKESCFYTNIFQDFSSLANTPINVLYSLQDELACYNATAPLNVGGGFYIPYPYIGGGTDLINTPLSTFISTAGAYGNGLNRADYSNTNPVATSSNINDLQTENSNRILASEGTGACSNRRYTTTALTPSVTGSSGVQHVGFEVTIYQTVIRQYLTSRLA